MRGLQCLLQLLGFCSRFRSTARREPKDPLLAAIDASTSVDMPLMTWYGPPHDTCCMYSEPVSLVQQLQVGWAAVGCLISEWWSSAIWVPRAQCVGEVPTGAAGFHHASNASVDESAQAEEHDPVPAKPSAYANTENHGLKRKLQCKPGTVLDHFSEAIFVALQPCGGLHVIPSHVLRCTAALITRLAFVLAVWLDLISIPKAGSIRRASLLARVQKGPTWIFSDAISAGHECPQLAR